MKKILRYDFWFCIVAWCLFLNGKQITGTIAAAVLLVYNCFLVRKINNWRLISTFLMFSIFSYFLINSSNIKAIYHYIFPFLLVMMMNISLVNEVSYKLKAKAITPVYFLLTTTMIVFTAIALIIPESPLLPFYRSNLLVFVALIFFPSFINMSVCLLSKNRQRHAEVEKLYN